ncbi:protein of unknown function [Methanoculleus bourgensis]|uniref:Uncharacterized protein n=1 Tax=Methanoculleus bourgensis TaxID=83986 RepID=A0A0X3BNS0_9EURY|nr:protein of unknown function [Methanoculleus bourgensis]
MYTDFNLEHIPKVLCDRISTWFRTLWRTFADN